MSKRAEKPKPVGLALVVCDNVYRDSSGKMSLVGLFTRVSATRFPAKQRKLCVFVSMTDAKPGTHCRLDIVNAETEAAVVHTEGPMPSDGGPLAVWDMVFEMTDLTFPEPGMYFVRFFGNDQILIHRPILVVEVGKAQSNDDPHNEKED